MSFCLISEIIHPRYITLPRVHNFDIKQKGMEYLFYYMPPTLNKIWENKDQQNTVNFAQNTIFFVKTEL